MKINHDCCLIIFVRNIELGKVKSRIAKVTGEQKALDIYCELEQTTRQTALKLDSIGKVVYYSDFIPEKDEWDKHLFEKSIQKGPDLGTRMGTALQDRLRHTKYAILIGSDCPFLSPQHILSAFELLETNDLVLGPANDGGYYLIGMKQHHQELFKDVEWGSSQVLEQTIQKAGKLKIGLLEKLSDIDTYEDYLNWKTSAS